MAQARTCGLKEPISPPTIRAVKLGSCFVRPNYSFGGGVMIWAGIIGNEIVGPFLVPDGLKMNLANYCSFLDKNFMPWYQREHYLPTRQCS